MGNGKTYKTKFLWNSSGKVLEVAADRVSKTALAPLLPSSGRPSL